MFAVARHAKALAQPSAVKAWQSSAASAAGFSSRMMMHTAATASRRVFQSTLRSSAAASGAASTAIRRVPARFMSTSSASAGLLGGAAGRVSPLRMIIGGAAGLGVLGLTYYGATASAQYDELMAAELAASGELDFYPPYMRDRINKTFMAIAAGLGITAATAAAAFRSSFMRSMNPTALSIGSLVALMGSMFLTMAAPADTPMKYIGGTVFSSVMGVSLFPLCALGGPLLGRAALYTGGIVGSLALVAANSPSDRFLGWGAPLSMGLGVVFISSFAGMVFPAAAPLMHNIWMYGGLALFSAFALYDTSKLINNARILSDGQFDSVNQGLQLYMDIINIFVRVALMLSGSNKK